MMMARYKHLNVKRIPLSELKPPDRPKKELSPRQRAQLERDQEITSAINEAVAAPASEAVVIEVRSDQKLATLRAAVARILAAEPRQIRWGVRGPKIVFSKGEIPGRGGRRSG